MRSPPTGRALFCVRPGQCALRTAPPAGSWPASRSPSRRAEGEVSMSDLLAIGEALVELNQSREGGPFVQGFGGDTSNAMIAAARLGADASYFTAVGADRFRQALTEL